MKRTIEKLHRDRVEKEEDYARRLKLLLRDAQETLSPERLDKLDDRLARLEKRLSAKPDPLAAQAEVLAALRASRDLQARALDSLREIVGSLAGLIERTVELGDVRDREWDALGSNHVGIIFKSMEWRVDKLAAVTEDARLLMRAFLAVEDKLGRLLAVLEEKKLPAPREVDEILEPIRDWRYAGFEDRYRGSEDDIRRQQEDYLAFFPKGGKVLDLGCGRGEFLDMLRENGFQASGVDLNGHMVGTCRDKGLDGRKGDLLEALASQPDASLHGVFSSQVIEHLPPAAIRRLVELSFQKLRPGGTLVLETVNPLSVFALVHIYFLDLSHRTPVHPQALRFLMEAAGFDPVEVRESRVPAGDRLQSVPPSDETSVVLNKNIDALNALLFASPNFAAIGKKP